MYQDQHNPRLIFPDDEEIDISASKRLEPFVDQIDELLKRGFSRKVILERLNAMGISLKMSGFAAALQRIRKRRRASQSNEMAYHVSAPNNTKPVTEKPTQVVKEVTLFNNVASSKPLDAPNSGTLRKPVLPNRSEKPPRFVYDLKRDVTWKFQPSEGDLK